MKVSLVVSLFFFATTVNSVKCFIFADANREYNFDNIDIIQSRYLQPAMKIYQEMVGYLDDSEIKRKQCHRAYSGLQPIELGVSITNLNAEIKDTLPSLKRILTLGDNQNTQPEFKKIVDAVLEKYLKPVDDVYREYEAMETTKFTRTRLSVKFKLLLQMILGNNTFPILFSMEQLSKNIYTDIFDFPFFDPKWQQCDKFEMMRDARFYLYLRMLFTELRIFHMTLQMCAISLFINKPECEITVTGQMIEVIIFRINNYISAVYAVNVALQPRCNCLKAPERLRGIDPFGTITNYIAIPDTVTDIKSFRVFTNLTEHICFHIAEVNSRDNGWEICYGEDLNTQDVIRKNGRIIQIVPIENTERFNTIMMRQFTLACFKNVWTISYTEPNNPKPMGKLSFNESCASLSHYTLTTPHVRNNSFLWVIPDVGYYPDQYSRLVDGLRGCYCQTPQDKKTFKELVELNSTRVCRSVSSDGFEYVEHLLQNNGQLTEDFCIDKNNPTFSNIKDTKWTLYSGCKLPKSSLKTDQKNQNVAQ